MISIGRHRSPGRPRDLICVIAAFVAEDPAAAGATDRELVEAIAEMWPDLPAEDLECSFGIAAALRAARLAAPKTREQALIDRTRLFHGTRAAGELIFKYDLHGRPNL